MSKSGDAIIRAIRTMVAKSEYERFSDRDLLRRFVVDGDEAAFTALMRRHGPMVMGMALRSLRHQQDAEDVCQATFLLLARKAKTTAWRDSIANWLYEAAYHLCLKTRESTNRRNARERKVRPKPAPDAMADITLRELQSVLDAELARLPKKYRAPVILCCLEGKSRDEAARCLGVPLSTVISRLVEGRELLRRRLASRGLALSLAFAGFSLDSGSVHAALPPGLAAATSRVAVQVLAKKVATSALSPKVLGLVDGGIQAMFFAKLKLGTAVLLAVCLAAGGAARLTQWALAQNSGKASRASSAAGRQAESKQSAKLPQAAGANGPEARDPLKEAREAADAIEDPQWKAWLLQILAETHVASGNKVAAAQIFQDAIRVAKEVKSEVPTDPTARAHHTLAGIAWAQAKAGDVRGALQTVDAIDNEGRREQALAEIARAQAGAGDIKGALKAAEAFSARWKDYVLAEAAAVSAKSGDLMEASRIVEAIENEEERVQPLAALARAQFKNKDLEAVHKTLQASLEIVSRMDKDQEGDGRTVALAAITKVQADIADFKAARKTVEDIKDARWKGPTLGYIATAQAKMGRFKEALETVDELEHAYHKGDALANIVTVQVRLADLQSAQETAESIESVAWHINALLEIAKAQAKAGDRAGALRNVKKASDKGGIDGRDILDEEPGLGVGAIRNATLGLIAKTNAQIGQEQEAFAWARKQASPELRVVALICIADGIELRKAEERRTRK